MKLFNLHVAGVSIDVNVSRASSTKRSEEEYARGHNTFEGDFSSWLDAMKHANGYDSPLILDRAIAATRAVANGKAAFERDTVLFDKLQISYPLLAGLLYAATNDRRRLSVMDVGGALGSSYQQNKTFLSHLDSLRWGVVEQGNFVRAGQTEFQREALGFFRDFDTCVQAIRPNFLLLSSVLQYLEQPYQILSELLGLDIPFVFIDRTMAHRLGYDRLAIQRVPPTIYSACYPVWLLDADKLESVFEGAGYEVIDHFDPHPGSTFGQPDFSAPYAAWFLRKASARR